MAVTVGSHAQAIVAHNRLVCLWLSFLRSVFLATSVISLYYLDLGLSQAEIFMLQTILSIVVVCCDIPFGNLADRIGIRKVMIVGAGIMLLQGVSMIFCRTFWQLIPALIGTGLYVAAQSNTTNAVMALSLRLLDDIDKTDREVLFRQFLSANARARYSGMVVATLSGSLLTWSTSIVWTVWLQPIVWLACLICAWQLIEPPITGNADEISKKHINKSQIGKVLRLMILERKEIRYALVLRSMLYTTELLCLWIVQPRLVQAGLPAWTSGLIGTGMCLTVIARAGWGQQSKASESLRYWSLPVVAFALGLLWSGLRSGLDGFIAMTVALVVCYIFGQRLFDAFLDEVLPDHGITRNTELAVATTIPALLFAVLAPGFGLLIDVSSLGTACIVLGSACGIVGGGSLWLLHRSLRRIRI